MITSMTGFGRAEMEAPYGKLIVETQSVNRKFLEIFISLPKEFSRFENDVRKLVNEKIQRGLVSVRVYLIPDENRFQKLLPDVKMLKTLKAGWEKIATELSLAKEEISLDFLMRQLSETSQIQFASEDDFESVQKCLMEALHSLIRMKQQEGSVLKEDISSRLKIIEQVLGEIEKGAPNTTIKLRQKLQERLEECMAPGKELDERLLREVAIFSEKVDISEEITRFRSHLSQYLQLLTSQQGVIGRKMDFLVQEMGREINTIGSKAMDAEISQKVVDVKSELEKIREQIQNIE